MSGIIPTLGGAGYQAEQINKRRADAARELNYHQWKQNGAMIHVGNPAEAALRSSSDDYWVTSTSVGDPDHDSNYHWMPYQVGQAAKAAGERIIKNGPQRLGGRAEASLCVRIP